MPFLRNNGIELSCNIPVKGVNLGGAGFPGKTAIWKAGKTEYKDSAKEVGSSPLLS